MSRSATPTKQRLVTRRAFHTSTVASWGQKSFTVTRVSAGCTRGDGRKTDLQVRRPYDKPASSDGIRVLVDRIWPRGLTKAKASLAEWCKQVAPSTAVRKWYGHDPAKFEEFVRRYRAELEQPERATALLHLRELAESRRLTLLTATKEADISEAAVLADLLGR